MVAAHAVFDHNGDRFVGRVVDDCQAFECASRGNSVEYKVDRPDFVRSAGAHQRLPLTHGNLPASTTPDLQPFQRIEPLHTFVVDQLAMRSARG